MGNTQNTEAQTALRHVDAAQQERYRESLAQLQSMGFDEEVALEALVSTGGNGDAAANMLLSGTAPTPAPAPAPAPGPAPQAMSEEDMLNAAIAASLQDAPRAAPAQARAPPTRAPKRSAASSKAADAALRRLNQGATFGTSQVAARPGAAAASGNARASSRTPPPAATPAGFQHDLRVPKRMEEHSVEVRLRRCANRVAKTPSALRMLLKAIKQLQADPSNPRYRRINLGNRIFAQTIGAANGGVDFLLAAGFEAVTEAGGIRTLTLRETDTARIWLAVAALEEAADTPGGRRGLEEEAFQAAVQRAANLGHEDDVEAVARAEYVSKVPAEPSGGGNITVVKVKIGGDLLVERRFYGDDVLDNVIDFLGGYGSSIPEKLRSGAWNLVDVTMFPKRKVECDAAESGKTLQALELWPSALLELELPAWAEEGDA